MVVIMIFVDVDKVFILIKTTIYYKRYLMPSTLMLHSLPRLPSMLMKFENLHSESLTSFLY